MTPHERFLALMHFECVDRMSLWEGEPWPSALRRWQREERSAGNEPPAYIPHIDHAIPYDVPCENFLYYWERKKELLGIRPA